jgi:hypothetical protein
MGKSAEIATRAARRMAKDFRLPIGDNEKAAILN